MSQQNYEVQTEAARLNQADADNRYAVFLSEKTQANFEALKAYGRVRVKVLCGFVLRYEVYELTDALEYDADYPDNEDAMPSDSAILKLSEAVAKREADFLMRQGKL